nr:MAG TPA: hypothetical protein [Bacteriophage sp.]
MYNNYRRTLKKMQYPFLIYIIFHFTFCYFIIISV